MAGDVPNGGDSAKDVVVPNGAEKAAADVEAGDSAVTASSEKPVIKRTYGGEPAEEINVPEMSYLKLIGIFLRFGFMAFGGPVQQIAMMKEQLVDKEGWVTKKRFTRVFGVYQALPGPEATELACYFGLIAKGYLGALLGGLCFILPGFCIMLLFAYLYTQFKLFENPGFLASFYGIRPCVPAFALKATIKLSEHALMDHTVHPATESTLLSLCGLMAFLLTVFRTPFFASLGFGGVVNMLHQGRERGPYLKYAGFAFLVAGVAGNVAYLGATNSRPGVQQLTAGLRTQETDHGSLGSLFVTGLLAGLVTFGGAFTAVPYVFRSLVTVGKQLTEGQFLDGIAVVNVVPTPLVMFITWDGFVAQGIAGAVVMTIGIFLPCFSFTVIFHRLFMWLTENSHFAAFIDGVSASVMGIIAETVCQLTLAAIHTGMDTLVFTVCCGYIFNSKNKNAPIVVLVVAALAGQILYEKNSGNFKVARTSATIGGPSYPPPLAALAGALGFQPPAPL